MIFTERMKSSKLFTVCFTRGRCVRNEFFCTSFIPNRLPFNRMGISVGKKDGRAVDRTLIKRKLRAAYTVCELEFPIGYDIVFRTGRKPIMDVSSERLAELMRKKLIPEMNKPAEQKLKKKR